MSEDLITNRQRAVAAFETIRNYAATRNKLRSLTFRGGITGNQRQDQDRLMRLLAALRHHSDCISGLRFDDATGTGRWQYDRERTRLRGLINPYQVAAARRAIHVHLMAAFGETEPTTHANAGYRLALAGAYTDAYKLASATSGPNTLMPTEQTGRDFPPARRLGAAG